MVRSGRGLRFHSAAIALAGIAGSMLLPPRVHAAMPFSSSLEFARWREGYYALPDATRAIEAFLYFPDSVMYGHPPERARVNHFYAALFQAEPALMRAIFEAADKGTQAQRLQTIAVLWLANTDESLELLAKASKRWVGEAYLKRINEAALQPPRDLLREPLQHPAEVDQLWERFFATGDTRPVARIAEQLRLIDSADEAEWRIGAAAMISLKERVLTHPAIAAALRQAMPGEEAATLARIEEVLWTSETLHHLGVKTPAGD